jgi:PHP family Zn ribbon phosphoesterase
MNYAIIRFYAEDMIHPNTIAIEYVWEKLAQNYFNSNTISINKEIEDIQKISPTIVHGTKIQLHIKSF